MSDSHSSSSNQPHAAPHAERLPETNEFLAILPSLGKHLFPELSGFLQDGHPLWIARAPGRLDVMGGIADYSGSLVLQMPIREATYVGVQEADDRMISIASLPSLGIAGARRSTISVEFFQTLVQSSYDSARERLRRELPDSWCAYPIGVLLVLAKELGWNFDQGLRILIRSQVPEAKGVSSSAALEVATMQAACFLLDEELQGIELARLCQLAENRVVGAPCGIMDQMTSAVGREGELLILRCQPAEVIGFASLPSGARVWGIDSGIRHAVSGSDYTAVRTGAFMGYRVIAGLAGLGPIDINEAGKLHLHDPRWHGYLANLTPDEFECEFSKRLPIEIKGSEFLEMYDGTTDEVTQVDPARTYAIRQPTAHPVYENSRVQRFASLLDGTMHDGPMQELGQLMYASHESYSACGLGSGGTDQIVELVRQAGSENGLFGAKITGGGSGGTVAVLGRPDAEPAIQGIVARYHENTGRQPFVFSGSSPGTCGVPRLVYRG